MAGRRHHLRRALTVLSGLLGSAMLMLVMAPGVYAACEDAKAVAERPGYCAKRDPDGRCTLWFDGQIYLGSGNKLPVEHEPLPPDRFLLYALVSPCDGGPAPPNQNTFECDLWSESCSDPDARLYQVWRQYYEEAEPEWQPATAWEQVPWACVTAEQGSPHDELPVDQPWITYITSYPGGDLVMEPPGGLTLTGLETNFYTETPTEIRYTAVHNSGPVQMCVEPAQWIWDFGDGNTATTDTPGAPYPDLEVTHQYKELGTFEPSVSIAYTRYLNSGRGWTTNDLLADSVPGVGETLRTMELVPRLVSPDTE